jgi:hypothetical protein
MNQRESEDSSPLSIPRTLSLGIRVVLSEIHWSILRALRAWEIRQLRKRLEREYRSFGQLTASRERRGSDTDLDSEIELCRKQIDFLEKEVEHLRQDLSDLRRNKVRNRRSKWAV